MEKQSERKTVHKKKLGGYIKLTATARRQQRDQDNKTQATDSTVISHHPLASDKTHLFLAWLSPQPENQHTEGETQMMNDKVMRIKCGSVA